MCVCFDFGSVVIFSIIMFFQMISNHMILDFVVWAFDTETECWSQIEAKGDIPVFCFYLIKFQISFVVKVALLNPPGHLVSSFGSHNLASSLLGKKPLPCLSCLPNILRIGYFYPPDP